MRKKIGIWLSVGLVMILIQIMLGGITRLTGSGLSITKWEIVTGTIPPLGQKAWEKEFDLYKQTPQYEKINHEIDISRFRFIYLWEYCHRLWARIMGLVFFIPFIFFLWNGSFSKRLLKKLIITIFLAGLVASFGWIMVASGLTDRPWVNAYKLTFHLGLACLLFSYLLWMTLDLLCTTRIGVSKKIRRCLIFVFVLVVCQILLGGIVAGSRAAILYPTWPDMNGEFLPEVLMNHENWTWNNFVNYDRNAFFPALIQFVHRMMAYVILIGNLILLRHMIKQKELHKLGMIILSITFMQVLLGILTVSNSIVEIPIIFGVLHQLFGVLLFGVLLVAIFLIYEKNKSQEFSTLVR